ncbi:MAG: hypothetical protein K0R15_763 [Clostridiales bacterium]|jgi:hypothetical protein|nr:hypothetical protein [Clostridiales bacterium]
MIKKRIISIALLVTMIFTQLHTPVLAENGLMFTDLPNDWSTEAIEHAIENGLLSGDNGKIMPKENLTRAQLASVLVRAFGATKKGSLSAYVDVSNTDWYYDAMATAVQMELFEGSDGRLYPNRNITREEAFAVLSRAFKLTGGSIHGLNKFTDKDSISPWAVDGVASLISEGYISGTDGKINPKNFITRAEFAQIMYNIARNYIRNAGTYTSNYTKSVIINVANVTLKNLTIEGDLIIGDGVGDGEVILDGVTVTGRIIIRGGSKITILNNSNVNDVLVTAINTTLVVSGTVSNLVIDAMNATIIANKGANIPQITINGEGTTVRGEGQVGSVYANTNNIKVTVPFTKVIAGKGTSGVTAGNVTLGAGTSATVNWSGNGIVEDADYSNRIVTLSISDPTLTILKTYDGSRTAAVKIGKLQGVASGHDVLISAVATYDNAIVGINKTITVTYQISGADAGKYIKPADYVVKTGEIKALQLTISAPILQTTKPYDGGTSAGVTIGELGGVIQGDDVTITSIATYDTNHAGKDKTITIEYSLAGEDAINYIKPENYTDNSGEITKIQLTVADPTLTTSKTYDAGIGAFVSAGELAGVVSGEDVTVSAIANYDTNVVGTGKKITVEYTLAGENAGNYIKPEDYIVNTGEILALQLTIDAPMLQTTKPYDGGTSAGVITGELGGVIQGDDVTISYIATYDTNHAGKDKTITIEYSLAGEDAINYIKPGNYTDNSGEITKIQLTVTNPTLTTSKTYDARNDAFVSVGKLSGVVSGEDVTVSAIANYDTDVVGTGKKITVQYTLAGVNAGNYIKPADYIVNTGEIKAVQLTISAPILQTTKPYDGGTSAGVTIGELGGVIQGDDVTISYIATYDTNQAGKDKAITIEYSLVGEDAINYIKPENYTDNSGEITKIQLTVANPTLTTSKTYDAGNDAFASAGELAGVVSGEDVTVSAIANYDTTAVGTGKKITVEYTLAGVNAGNYIKPADYIVNTGEILALQLTIDAPTITTSKIYDRSTAASVTVGEIIGVYLGEDVTVSGVATYDNAVVGKNKIITVEYHISGVNSSNYIKPVNHQVMVGEIVALQLEMLSVMFKHIKPYDGNTTADVDFVTVTGVMSGDDVIPTGIGSYDNPEPGTGKTITVEFILGGKDAVNYIRPESYSLALGEITKLEQVNPTGLIGLIPTTIDNNDGKITGTTDKMEYKLSTSTDWIPVTGAEITNLLNGTYVVRYAATPYYKVGPATEVIIPEYIESLSSKSIANLDFATKYQYNQVKQISKEIASSDFSGANRKYFTITDQAGNIIPVDLWWNIPLNEYATTPALAVGSAIESYIQQWFYDNKGGAAGIMNRTMYAYGSGTRVTIGTFSADAGSSIQVGGKDWAFFFDSNEKVTGVIENKSANVTFTISDGVNTATILLNQKYNNISELVTAINLQIAMTDVVAFVKADGTDKFILVGNNLVIDGLNKGVFFSTFETV